MKSSPSSRRKFTKRFKETAVRKLIRGTPIGEVARACRVNQWILRRWHKEFEEFGARAFGGYGKQRRAHAAPKSKPILLYLSSDELDAVKAASSAAGFRSLAEFARSHILRATVERPVAQVETILGELAVVATRLTQILSTKRGVRSAAIVDY
jgi:transposase-like protein